MKIDIDVVGLSRTVAHFNTLAERAENPRPALEGVADDLRMMQRTQFRTGAGWEPLKDSTLAQKRREGQPARILVATGMAERSYTQKGAPGAVSRLTKTSLTFGSSVYYLRFHTKHRPPLRPTETAENKARARIIRWIVDGHA